MRAGLEDSVCACVCVHVCRCMLAHVCACMCGCEVDAGKREEPARAVLQIGRRGERNKEGLRLGVEKHTAQDI